MNYLVEGLQGSGKSTLVQKLSELHPDYTVYREGDYSPIELAWCAYVGEPEYKRILSQYPDLQAQIKTKTASEGDRRIVCYTQVKTDNTDFYRDLEQFEIYNNRIPFEEFRRLKLSRYQHWLQDNTISECALFQNTVEDMILFRQSTDEEIIAFFKEVRHALDGKNIRILYLKADDIEGNLKIIRKERSDEQGRELWFPMLCDFFNSSPYAKARKISGEEGILSHLMHRQELELRICQEVFPNHMAILHSKKYEEKDLP